MPPRQLDFASRAFVAFVDAGGAIAFVALLATWDPAGVPTWPALIFGPLACASVSVSSWYRGSTPSATAFQLGTAFVFALFLISGPAPAALVAGVMSALDWARWRRSPLVGTFNLGQLFLSAGLGAVAARLAGDHPAWSGTVGILVFSAVNHALTHLIVSLSARRSLLARPAPLGDGFRAEVLCIACGIVMGLLWKTQPWHAVVGAVPLISYAGAHRQLSRRKEALDRREDELRALQDLAAAFESAPGADLHAVVVRNAASALTASGALLAALEDDGRTLRVLAATGLATSAPEILRVSRLADGFFEARTVRRIEDLRHDAALYPELSFLGPDFAGGALAAPLRLGPGADGLLLVVHGPERRAFDEDDMRRLALFSRFVEPRRSVAPATP